MEGAKRLLSRASLLQALCANRVALRTKAQEFRREPVLLHCTCDGDDHSYAFVVFRVDQVLSGGQTRNRLLQLAGVREEEEKFGDLLDRVCRFGLETRQRYPERVIVMSGREFLSVSISEKDLELNRLDWTNDAVKGTCEMLQAQVGLILARPVCGDFEARKKDLLLLAVEWEQESAGYLEEIEAQLLHEANFPAAMDPSIFDLNWATPNYGVVAYDYHTGEPVAFIMATITTNGPVLDGLGTAEEQPFDPSKDMLIYVDWAFVNESSRGRGLGAMVVNTVLNALRKTIGDRRIWIVLASKNDDSTRFWRATLNLKELVPFGFHYRVFRPFIEAEDVATL
jgi:GNAT superfamily N-acetyltransferase